MDCLVCGAPARNRLAIRLRKKPGPLNVWSPDSDAYLCKRHAEGGVDITVSISPTNTQQVEVTYTSGSNSAGPRVTPIKHSAA